MTCYDRIAFTLKYEILINRITAEIKYDISEQVGTNTIFICCSLVGIKVRLRKFLDKSTVWLRLVNSIEGINKSNYGHNLKLKIVT